MPEYDQLAILEPNVLWQQLTINYINNLAMYETAILAVDGVKHLLLRMANWLPRAYV